MKVYVELKCTFAGRKNTVKLEPDGKMHCLEAISQGRASGSLCNPVWYVPFDMSGNMKTSLWEDNNGWCND